MFIEDPTPTGGIEAAISPAASQIRVTGWVADRGNRPADFQVDLYAGTTHLGTFPVDIERSVGAFTGRIGFDITVSLSPGTYDICVLANNNGTREHTKFPCQSVTVRAAVPDPTTPPAPTPTPGTPAPGTPPSGTLPPGTPGAQPGVPSAPAISVRLRAVKKKSRLKVDIGPDLADTNYRFKVQRRMRGKWRTVSRTQTLGPRDVVVLNFTRASIGSSYRISTQ